MNIATSSPQMREQATQTLAAITALRTEQAQYVAADKFLASVATHADATPAERLVASTLRACTSVGLRYRTAVNAQHAAMQVLASGVSGPVGVVLAKLGLQVGQGAYNQQDQYKVGAPWLAAVKAEGEILEQRVAEAALQATRVSLKYTTAISAQHQALTMVKDGLTGTAPQVVAAFGEAAMRKAYNHQDQHAVSQQVLPLIKNDGTSPAATALAAVALSATAESMKYSTAVHAEELALKTIAAGTTGDVDVLRAAYGLDAMHGAYNQEDEYKVGSAVLQDLAGRALAPVAGTVAKAAQAALGAASVCYSTAAGFQQAVLKSVIAPQPSVEKTLAEVGRQLGSFSYSSQDRFAVGRGLVNEIKRASNDPQVLALVRYCEQMSGVSGATYAQAIAAQDVVFNGIASGNMTVPAIPVATGGGQSTAQIAIPTLDPSASPEDQKAAVAQAIARNQETLRGLRDDEAKASAEAAEAQQRITELEVRTTIHPPDNSALNARWNRVSGWSAPVVLLGLGGLLISSPLLIGAGAVAGALYATSQVVLARARKTQLAYKKDMDLIMLDIQQEMRRVSDANGRRASSQKAQAQVEKAIDDAQGILDTLRMATAPAVRGDTTVQQREEYVMVGGLKIPRNAGTQTRETAL